MALGDRTVALPDSKIEQVRLLRREAANLRGATERWREKYSDRSHYDKQGFGFTTQTDRSTAFVAPRVAFEAYVGTYGNSSVGTAWHVNADVVAKYFVKALNANKQAILDDMAAMAEADAAALLGEARKEVTALNALLDEVEAGPVAVSA